MPPGHLEDRHERALHPAGDLLLGRGEGGEAIAQEAVEDAPAALVGLEQRHVAEHVEDRIVREVRLVEEAEMLGGPVEIGLPAGIHGLREDGLDRAPDRPILGEDGAPGCRLLAGHDRSPARQEIGRKENIRERLRGLWRGTETGTRDNDHLDLVEPAFIASGPNGAGGFRFQGSDEGDEVFGDGWAECDGADTIRGENALRNGDETTFKARGWPRP
ncbi:hypothetical protein [uncultured Methylobacterium sp.]|uniref:hypothetical protein n=1 Tax=uncultured Methylobacterium sp. TaxID=157278 RepID=UPI002594E224|nr:hypothetical protein [uncultured Methylobacterium sp.]